MKGSFCVILRSGVFGGCLVVVEVHRSSGLVSFVDTINLRLRRNNSLKDIYARTIKYTSVEFDAKIVPVLMAFLTPKQRTAPPRVSGRVHHTLQSYF